MTLDASKTESQKSMGQKHCPKQVKELSAFEKELIAVVKIIKFRNTRSDFQTTLQEDIRLIHDSKKTMAFSDKISNMYRLTKEEHSKLLRNAITSKYKKTNKIIKDKITKKGNEILKNKEALHRLDINEESVFSLSRIIKRTSKTTQQSD